MSAKTNATMSRLTILRVFMEAVKYVVAILKQKKTLHVYSHEGF